VFPRHLKSIANNTEIDEIHDRWQKKCADSGEDEPSPQGKVEEWDIPREADKDWPKEAKDLLKSVAAAPGRQKEIDASIARKAIPNDSSTNRMRTRGRFGSPPVHRRKSLPHGC